MSTTITKVGFSVAANSKSANLLSDESFEYADFPAKILMGVNGAAVGLNLYFAVQNEVIVDDQPINGLNRFPLNPDDMIWSAGAGAGNKVVIRLRNTTGAAITADMFFKAVPVGVRAG